MGESKFGRFWPIYVAAHQNRTNRIMHFVGTSLALIILITSLLSQWWWGILVAAVTGYSFAWIGHFGFEKNRPATFGHPFFSLAADWVMWWKLLTRQALLK